MVDNSYDGSIMMAVPSILAFLISGIELSEKDW